MAGFFSIFSKKNESNIVPMENTLENKLLYWSLALLLPIVLIIGSIIYGFGLMLLNMLKLKTKRSKNAQIGQR